MIACTIKADRVITRLWLPCLLVLILLLSGCDRRKETPIPTPAEPVPTRDDEPVTVALPVPALRRLWRIMPKIRPPGQGIFLPPHILTKKHVSLIK